jgi:GTP pyrophosphokinase
MVTVKKIFNDDKTWLELQKENFDERSILLLEQSIEIAKKYYVNQNFYPTNVNLLLHALNCANKIANLNLYLDAVIATILYAVPKFNDKWQSELQMFGSKVIELIDGVSRVNQIRKIGSFIDIDDKDDKKAQTEIVRKMLLAMASDIRVVLIVLVGRGELMLNLKSCVDTILCNKIALETVEIYAPLANRLGLWQIKWELEDLSFKYLHPEQYRKIANLLDETRQDRLDYIDKIKIFLTDQMTKSSVVNFQVTGRAKHIYSIWRKMKKKNYDFDDLYDIRALRVLVTEVKDCYTVLGIIHTNYSPIPGEFDDYISNPKSNNYQSLHTCVIGPENKVVEIQIRTFAMHDHAEYGVAAHWRYKEFGDKQLNTNSNLFAEKVAWLRQLLDWREELTEKYDITDIFKNEIFSDTIYNITPKGKVISLPKGSTSIDFAYALHSDIGNRCRGAKVDGHIVPLSTPLQNGQRVDILTVKEGGPSINWLHDGWVKSPKAISNIRRYIRNQNNEFFYNSGLEVFEREIAKFSSNIRPKNLEIVAKLNYENEKILCIDLGKGEISPTQIRNAINKIIYSKEQFKKDNFVVKDAENNQVNYQNIKNDNKNFSGILVEGVSGIVNHIAKCCKPIPGDQVIGFITKVNGVAIHRPNCIDLKRQAKIVPNKVVKVSWGNNIENTLFTIDINVIANDRSGLLHDLTDLFAVEKLHINGLKTLCRNNKAYMVFTLQLKGVGFNFEALINKIFGINGVIEAIRK